MTKKEHIQNLQKNWEDFIQSYPKQANTLANLLNTISSDIYSENQRFIFEFIQNADDAAISVGNEIYFDFHDDFLTISHNGKPFDKEDIHAITDAGEGTKSSDITKTGYKGIGFKSVFGKSNKVCIISDGYRLRFDKSFYSNGNNKTKIPWQLIPIWTEFDDLENSNNWEQLENNYTVSTIIELENSLNLKNELNEILSNGKLLLFLRKITKISISINGNLDYTIEKQIHKNEESYDEVKLLKNDKELSSWIVKTFNEIQINDETQLALKQDDKTPDKLKEAKLTEISFAAKIENGKIKEIYGEESLIFTFLPTSVTDFGFPFLVNSSFLTTANRQSMHTDSIWNQWLFSLVAEKILEWLEMLAANNKYRLQILHLLPHKFNNSSNELHISFDKTFEKKVKEAVFIPTTENYKLKTASEVIFDNTGLSEIDFIPNEILVDFINQKENTKYTKNSFVNNKLQKVERLKSLGTKYFEPDNLQEFFLSEVFQTNHETKDNFKLINYFYQIDQSDETKEWREKLKTIPFIYNDLEILRAPNELCFPYKSKEIIEDGKKPTIIHKDVIPFIDSTPEINEWLRILGVTEPSDISYLENDIIPYLDTIIEGSNFKDITRYIFNLHKKNKLTHKHYQDLNGFKLLCKDNVFHEASVCFLSDFYTPILRLEKVYDNCNYVDETYAEKYDETTEWKLFFIKIGVSETISIKRIERTGETELINTFRCDSRFFWENSSPQGYSNWSFYDYSITKISFIEKATDYKFSKLFWEVLLNSTINFYDLKRESRGFWGMAGGRGANSGDTLPSYTEWILKNLPIIPTTMKTCLLSEEVFINSRENLKIAGNYLPVFNYEMPLSNEWKELLPFIQKLSLDNYLTVLEKFALQSEEEELKLETKKRIGLIYEKLTSELPDYNKEDIEKIKQWAMSNKLLCVSGFFEKANELYWVNIESFKNTSEHLKTIFIPENVATDTDNFKELLQLFGVQIIDDFYVEPKEKIEEDSLRKQLLVILPYFTSIIERKSYEKQYSDEFSRLLEIINKTIFYKTSAIVLSFEIQNEVIPGPSLYAYLDKGNVKHNLFYKNNWSNQITLFSLIPEILKLFNLTDLTEELKLLIQLNESEIKDWCLEQGYNIVNENITVAISKSEEEIVKITTNDNYEEEIKPSDASVLYDYSNIKTRISINEEAQEIIFNTLENNGFFVDTRYKITYTILEGVLNPKKDPIKVVVKSAKAGRIYFTPLEWLALSEEDSQLFVLTAGNKVRNITIEDLQKVNDEFHMRFNTEMFVLSNLKILADFFKRLPYTHFIFVAPESTSDYLQQFGLSERNKSYEQLSDKDKQLYYSKDDDKTLH